MIEVKGNQRAGSEVTPKAAYLDLYDSGILHARIRQALELLTTCRVCPRDCQVNRNLDERAVCGTGRFAVVSSYGPHLGEEDCLRGWRGSGTIFFSHCNLKCVFCQNYEISHLGHGREVRPGDLTRMMLELQNRGCHNINFVTPEHVVPQILEALPKAIEEGLRIPLVYNTSAYDSLESVRLLDGVIDIYMPDFKIWDPKMALVYLKARDYPEAARRALKEMHRQVGDLTLDEHGIARRGLLVRHLVMPRGVAGTQEIMRFIARKISPHTYVNLMGQYHPAGKVGGEKYVDINRPITREEFDQAVALARGEGITRLDARELDGHRWVWN